MLDIERNPVVHFGVITCRYLIYCTLLLLLLAPAQTFATSEDASCPQSTLRDQLRQSFKVLKLGQARNVKSCINLCCTKGICDLALLKRGRCYGISCSHHDLCRGIMNALRNKKRDISKRSISDTEDFPSEFPHYARSHGYCRQRRIVPHHVFLHGGRGVSNFHKLSNNIMSIRKCNQYCCEKKDCALAFLMRDKCYGVMCPDDGDCNSSDDMRVPVHLEIALVHRRDFTSKANIREETSTRLHKKSKLHHPRHPLQHRPKSKGNLHRKSGHLRTHRIKHHSKNRHVFQTRIHQRHHKSKTKLGVEKRRSHLPRKYSYYRRHKLKKYIRHHNKRRKKSGKVRNRKHRKIVVMDEEEEEEREKKKIKERERERKKKKEIEKEKEEEKKREKKREREREKEKEKKEKEKKEKEKKEKEKKEKEKKEKEKKEKEKKEKEKKEKEKDEEEENEEDNENQEEDRSNKDRHALIDSVKKIKEHSENDKKKRFHHKRIQNEEDDKNGQNEDLEDEMKEEEAKYLRNKNKQNRRKEFTKSNDNMDNDNDNEEDGERDHDSKDGTLRNKIFHRKKHRISHNDEGDSEDNEKGEVDSEEDNEKDETNEQNDERETDNVEDNESSKTKETKRKDKHKHSNTHFDKNRFNKPTKTKLHQMRELHKHLNRKHEDGDSDETNGGNEKKIDEEENSDEDTNNDKANDDFIHEETNEMDKKETHKVKEKSKKNDEENSHDENLEGKEHHKNRNREERIKNEEDDGGRHVYNSDDDDHDDEDVQHLKNQRRLERHKKKNKRNKKRKHSIGRKKNENIDSNKEYDQYEKNHNKKLKHQQTDKTKNEKEKATDRNEMDDDSEMNEENGMNETKEKDKNTKMDDNDEIEDSDDYRDIMKKNDNRKKKFRKKNNKFDEKIISKSNSDNIMSHDNNVDNRKRTHEAQRGESYKRKDKVIQHEDAIMEDKVFEGHDNDFKKKRKKSKIIDKKLRSKEKEDDEGSEDQNENMDKIDDGATEDKDDHDHGRNKYAEKKHRILQTDSKSEGGKREKEKSWKQKFNEDEKISEDKNKPSKKENINDNEDHEDREKDIRLRKQKSSKMSQSDDNNDNDNDSRTSKIHSETSKDKEGDSGTTRDDENHSGYTKSKEKSSKDEEDSDIMSDMGRDKDHSKIKDSEHKDYNIKNELHQSYEGDNEHHRHNEKDHLYGKHRKQDNVDSEEESKDQEDERWRRKKILKKKNNLHYKENEKAQENYEDHLVKHRNKYDHYEYDGDKVDHRLDKNDKEYNSPEETNKGDHRDDMEHSDDRQHNNKGKQDEKHVKADKKNQVGRQDDIKDNSGVQEVKDVYLHGKGDGKDTKEEKGDREDHKEHSGTSDDHKEDRSDMKDHKDHVLNWDNHKDERGDSEDHKEHSGTSDDHKDDRSDMKEHKDHELNWDNHKDERGDSEDHKEHSRTNDDQKEDRSDMKDRNGHGLNWDNHEDERGDSEDHKGNSGTSDDHKEDRSDMKDHENNEVNWDNRKNEGSGSEGHKEHNRTSEEHKDDGGDMEDHKDHEVHWNAHEDDRGDSEGHKEHSRTDDDHKEDRGGKKNTIEDLSNTKDNTEDLKDEKNNRGDDKGIKDANEDHEDDKGDSEDHKDTKDSKESSREGQENRKDDKDDKEDHKDTRGNDEDHEDNKGNRENNKDDKSDREGDNYHRDVDETHKDDKNNQIDDKGDIEDHKEDNGIKRDHKDDKGNIEDDENHENKGDKENHKNEKEDVDESKDSNDSGDKKYNPGSEEEHQKHDREEKDRKSRTKDADNNRIRSENNLGNNDNRTEEEKVKQNTEQDGTENGDLRSKFHEKSNNKNRQKEEILQMKHPNVTKNEDYRENTGIDLNYNNRTTTNTDNVNITGEENSVGRKQHGQEKMEYEWKSENLKHKNEKPKDSSSKLKGHNDFTDNNNSSKSKNNAEFPIHKKSLYHSLKDLKQEGNDIKPNVSNSDHDIMNTNRNYTSNTDKNPQPMGEKKKGDKTKYFNQKTSDWRESNKGDDVEDHHEKYFNQATRHWAVNQPTEDSGEYFHKMTSGWNLKNQTQAHDAAKYFNQRTNEWIGKNHTFKQPKKNHSENVPQTRFHKPKGNQYNKVHETMKNATVVEMNKIKHEEKQENYVSQRKGTGQMYFPQSEHRNKDNQTKIKPGIRITDQFQNLTSKNRNKESSSNVEMSGNKSRGTDRQQNNIKIAKTTHDIQDNESADEKVKNEIMKLLGQEPTETGLSKKNETTRKENPGFGEMPVLLKYNKSSSVQRVKSERPVIQSQHNAFPAQNGIYNKPEQKPKLISHVTEQHRQNKKKFFKSTSQHPSSNNRKNNVRENNVAKNSKGATKIQTKSTFQKYFVALKKPKGVLANKRKYLPLNTFHKQKLNVPKQTRVLTSSKSNQALNKNPKALTNSRRIIIGKSDNTAKNTNHVSKSWANVFPNSWTQIPTPPTPTRSGQNWNKPNDVLENEWTTNDPWQQYYQNNNVQVPTVMPTSSWNNMDWYSKGSQQQNNINPLGNNGIGNQNLILRTTPAPVYRNREYPLVNDGDKNYWKPEVGNFYGGNRQNEHSNMKPYNVITPRRNYVHDASKKNNNNLLHVAQNNAKQTAKPRNLHKGFDIHKILNPVGNVSSFIPRQKKFKLAQPMPRIINYPKKNKVFSSTPRPLQHHEEHKLKSKSSYGNTKTSQNPPIPHQNITKATAIKAKVFTTSRPKMARTKWRETNTTSGIVNPFQVNKIQPLHPTKVARNLTMVTKKGNTPLTTIPKGCFPGEIMSEMTLENGLDAGNFTKIGKTELMDGCINKCCEIKSCEVAIQMDNVCFAVKCHSKEACKIKSTLGKSSHHELSFISRTKKERQSMNDFDDDILGTEDVCPKEKAVGLNWKKTAAGTFDKIPCPKKAKGVARRKCSIESHWLLPDFSSCVTNDYEQLYKRAKRLVYGEDMSSLLQSLATVTTRTIDNSLIFGGDLKKTTEIMTSIVQEQGVKQDNDISRQDLKNFLITCSNLLDDSNKQEWKNIQKKTRGSADILRDSQTFALLASSKISEFQANVTYITNSIMLQLSHQVKGSKAMTFPDYSNTDIAIWDGEKDNLRVPASVFSVGDTEIASFSYKTLPMLLPMEDKENFKHSEPNSKILTSIVAPPIQDKITPAVTITLHHLKENRVNPRCVFWDFNLNPTHGGAWSTKGCRLQHSDKKHSVCRCNHLSNFAVLMDIVDSDAMQVTSKDQHYSREMAAMWICVPMLVVLLIGGLYTAFTWSRGPQLNPRSLNERSSLLRSSVTTQEIRYDYSSSPSRHLYAGTSPKFKELEWQNEFGKHVQENKENTFGPSSIYTNFVSEIELDSGIESNDLDDSSTHCDLSLSQDNLLVEESTEDFCTKKEIESTESEVSESEFGSNVDQKSPQLGRSDTYLIRMEVERRIFLTNLRRCIGSNDLSSNKT